MKTKVMLLLLGFLLLPAPQVAAKDALSSPVITPEIYTPKFSALNIKEQMTLSPIFTPDNALYTYAHWLKQANTSIDLQNQYITQFDDSVSWDNDPNPIVRELVNAKNRGVTVRVQVREDSDSDDVTSYLLSKGISVRWMGNSASNPDGDYLSATHNKLIIIDNKVILISSINFGENAFTNNREAGMVIQNANAAQHFTSIFEVDWGDGEVPPTPVHPAAKEDADVRPDQLIGFPSHTNIPRTNFTGVYNITLFTNPDNADDVIFDALKSAKESVYVSMYTISRPDFNNTLIDLKKNNPSIDIQVLISNRRVGGSENVDTKAAAESLVANFIPVYNSTTDDDKVDGFYHNKYWIIDGKHVFIYSGNWSPRSATPKDTSYSSGDPNRDMGVAVYDASDIASFIKTEVWDKDVAVGSAWELPVGVSQSTFEHGDIVSGDVMLKASVFGMNVTAISYRFGDADFTEVTTSDGTISVPFDTSSLSNGVTSFEVKATGSLGTFTDSATFTVANYDTSANNFRVLITEVLPNPEVVSDTEGEFIEVTNSFPFSVLIGDWQVIEGTSSFTIPSDYEIPAYTSVIFARNSDGFQTGYSVTADFEFSFSLANSNGAVQLLDKDGNVIDAVAYGDETAPDGSEAVSSPGAGESISRSPLYRDTNKASDFTLDSPSPKATVPNEPLHDSTSPTLPFPLLGLVAALPILRRKR